MPLSISIRITQKMMRSAHLGGLSNFGSKSSFAYCRFCFFYEFWLWLMLKTIWNHFFIIFYILWMKIRSFLLCNTLKMLFFLLFQTFLYIFAYLTILTMMEVYEILVWCETKLVLSISKRKKPNFLVLDSKISQKQRFWA